MAKERARRCSRDAAGNLVAGIVGHFDVLYEVPADFAMEIEFKITEDDPLVIKQARPWVN